jgi:hypothetical protein
MNSSRLGLIDGRSVSRNLDDGNQAGMNHDGSFLVVTNSSLQACTIEIHRSLQLLDSKHQAPHTSTDRGSPAPLLLIMKFPTRGPACRRRVGQETS